VKLKIHQQQKKIHISRQDEDDKKNHNLKESEQNIKIYHKFYLIVNDYESEKTIYKKKRKSIYIIYHTQKL
jgi:hypothetical protein